MFLLNTAAAFALLTWNRAMFAAHAHNWERCASTHVISDHDLFGNIATWFRYLGVIATTVCWNNIPSDRWSRRDISNLQTSTQEWKDCLACFRCGILLTVLKCVMVMSSSLVAAEGYKLSQACFFAGVARSMWLSYPYLKLKNLTDFDENLYKYRTATVLWQSSPPFLRLIINSVRW